MTRTRFRQLAAQLHIEEDATCNPGFLTFVRGASVADLAEIITLAGQQVGEIPKGTRINPEWFKLGPKADIAWIVHRDFAKQREGELKRKRPARKRRVL